MIGGNTYALFQAMFLSRMISMTGNKKLGMLAYKPNKDLDFIATLFQMGKVVPVIDKRYPLGETAEAFRYYGGGHVKGKIVIQM